MQEYIKALGRDENQDPQDHPHSRMRATHSCFCVQTLFASGVHIAAKISPFFHKQVYSIVLVWGGTDGLTVSQSQFWINSELWKRTSDWSELDQPSTHFQSAWPESGSCPINRGHLHCWWARGGEGGKFPWLSACYGLWAVRFPKRCLLHAFISTSPSPLPHPIITSL